MPSIVHPKGPLSRIITGAYIASYNLIKVVSRKDLTEERLKEVRPATDRLPEWE